jgi:DNA-binding NarL/FixJ family response regulator
VTIRVLLADDQALIRAGFAALVRSAPDMEVVGEAIDGDDAVRQALTLRPDVVLMDIRMPGTDGLTATRQITSADAPSGTRIIVLTTFEADEFVVSALRAGASGFLGKGVEPEDLLEAIRVVAAGDALLSPRATKGLIARFLAVPDDAPAPATYPLDTLTDREREILLLVAHGLSNDAIAARLVLSPLTVKTHVNHAMTKLAVRDRAQLVVIAYQAGLIRAGDPQPQ